MKFWWFSTRSISHIFCAICTWPAIGSNGLQDRHLAMSCNNCVRFIRAKIHCGVVVYSPTGTNFTSSLGTWPLLPRARTRLIAWGSISHRIYAMPDFSMFSRRMCLAGTAPAIFKCKAMRYIVHRISGPVWLSSSATQQAFCKLICLRECTER